MLHVIESGQESPQTFSKSIFLVGPTPRDSRGESWRPTAIRYLQQDGYDGVVFCPEPFTNNYSEQVEWEKRCLEMCDVILAWVPRDQEAMMAFTTNVEFGTYIDSGKLVYGRPEWAWKVGYLDWLYHSRNLGKPFEKLYLLIQSVLERLGDGAKRTGGERFVPLHIWKSKQFQNWYLAHKTVGNRLDDARVRWHHTIQSHNFLFSYILWCKIWIVAEGRHKENEFIFSRTDISTILPYYPAEDILDTKIVLVKEFRSPVRNSECFVYELPGGSSFKGTENALEIASDELKEESGLDIFSDRFYHIKGRQVNSTLCTHKAELFAVELEKDEIEKAENFEKENLVFGVESDTEKTYVVVRSLRDIISNDLLDWSMLGMIFGGLSNGRER